MKKISSLIPDTGEELSAIKGKEFIDKIGEKIVNELVTSILCGDNVRSMTETLTRRRLMLSNASMLVTFLRASSQIEDFVKKAPSLTITEIQEKKLTEGQKAYLNWLVGLTGKGIQNVLRGNGDEELKIYLSELSTALAQSVTKSTELFGKLSGSIKLKNIEIPLNWEGLLFLFTAIGAQTLTIRGSEKSLYGKLFEKLILGSMLTILGFTRIDPATSTKSTNAFWLSQREDKRESDATVLLKPGIGVRFDIGFIGPGNTEISLDKVSRFESQMMHGKQLHYTSTIVIVDRIGDKSRIKTLAKEIKGEIVQMSMSFWIREIAQILNRQAGFKHPILKMTDAESLLFIRQEMTKIDLKLFTV